MTMHTLGQVENLIRLVRNSTNVVRVQVVTVLVVLRLQDTIEGGGGGGGGGGGERTSRVRYVLVSSLLFSSSCGSAYADDP